MAQAGNMQKVIWAKYKESHEVVIPRLMIELKTPYKVAVEVGVYPNAVRKFLLQRGWSVIDGNWHPPQIEAEESRVSL